MKKMWLLCVIPFLLFMIFCTAIWMLPSQIHYAFTTIQGDVNELNNLDYDIVLSVGNNDQSNHSMIALRNQKGKQQYDIRMQQRINYDQYWNKHVDNHARYDLTLDLLIHNKDSTYYDGNDCTNVKEKIDRYPMTYNGYYYKNEMSYPLEFAVENDSYQPLLHAGLDYVSKDGVQLYKETISCSYGEEEIAYTVGTDNPYAVNESIIQAYHDNYFFMPITNVNVEGQNRIFKIQIVEDKERVYKAKAQTFAKLPENRYYDRFDIVRNKFYVFAHDDNKTYTMEYDMNGTLLREIELQKTITKRAAHFVNERYIVLWEDDELHAYDTQTMQIVDSYHFYDDQRLFDVVYRDGKFIILLDSSKQKEIMENDHVYYANQDVRYSILIIKEQKVYYEGQQVITTLEKAKPSVWRAFIKRRT